MYVLLSSVGSCKDKGALSFLSKCYEVLVLGYFSSNICRTMKPDIFTIHDRPIGPRHVDITPTVGRSRLVPGLARSQLRMVIRLIL